MKPIYKLALCAKCKHTGLSKTNGSPGYGTYSAISVQGAVEG